MNTSNAKSIAANASFLLTAQLIVRVLRGLYIVLLVRYLGPELYGVFQYVQNWFVTFTPLTLFGIGAILSREIGKDKHNGQHIVSTTFIIRLTSGIALSLTALALGLFTEPDADIRHLMIILAALLLGRALVNWVKEIFIAYEKTQYHVVQVTLSNIVQIGFGAAVMMNGGGIEALALVYITALFLEFIASFIFINRKIIKMQMDINIQKIKTIVKDGLPIGLTVALNRWMIFGPTIIGRYAFDYKNSLGQLSVILLLLFFASLIIDAVLHAALPVLSRAMQYQKHGSSNFINIALSLSIPLTCCVGLFTVTYNQPIIQTLFGAEYQAAGAILDFAVWLLLPYIWMTTMAQIFILKQDTLRLSFWTLLGVLWMAGLLPLCVMKFDLIGAIYAMAVGMTITTIGLAFHGFTRGYLHNFHLEKTAALSAAALLTYAVIYHYSTAEYALLGSLVLFTPFLARITKHAVHLFR